MADNPFSVQVVNPLQSLMLGQQSYKTGQDANKEQALTEARGKAVQLYQSGDAKGALATLLGVGAIPEANALGNTIQQDWTRQHTTQRDAVGDQHWATTDKRAAAAEGRAAADYENTPDQYAPNPRANEAGQPKFIDQYAAAKATPDTSFQTTIEQRKAAAIANGLDPSSPGFQSFVLTGKMPREDAQPLTATDKKAVLEADEHVQATQGAITNLQQAKQLSTKAFSGPYADKRGYAASFLGDTSDTGKAGIATTDLNNLVTTNALSQLKTIFGGNPTEGERGILLQIQGSASQPDAVRQKIYDRAIELANKRLQFNKQRADELRGGQFYKPAGAKGGAPPAAPAPTEAPAVQAGNVTSSGIKWSVQ